MTQPLELDLRTILPLTRAAYERGELQAFHPDPTGVGRYAGPCALGVALSPERRDEFDDARAGYASIDALVDAGDVLFPSEEQVADASALQAAHDEWLAAGASDDPDRQHELRRGFEHRLRRLEERYGVAT